MKHYLLISFLFLAPLQAAQRKTFVQKKEIQLQQHKKDAVIGVIIGAIAFVFHGLHQYTTHTSSGNRSAHPPITRSGSRESISYEAPPENPITVSNTTHTTTVKNSSLEKGSLNPNNVPPNLSLGELGVHI